METRQFDFVVVGSGLAGSAAAYRLSEFGTVALIGKSSMDMCNSYYAQGGIAAAVSPADSPSRHAEDTVAVGGGLCDIEVVTKLTSKAPELMDWLSTLGVNFDCDRNGILRLGLEGAHSQNRILHVGGDATGREVMIALARALADKTNVCRFTDMFVQGLIFDSNGAIVGVRTEFCATKSRIQETVLATRATVLATGGVGQLFSHTTNPMGATGDGVALAYLAGAAVCDMELVQFHPTALALSGNPHFLISEAVRGAGATIVTENGDRVMQSHCLKDLAPRDIVTREVFTRQMNGYSLYLDARTIIGFSTRFPTIYEYCMKNGFDPGLKPLPITPAAHFIMGGIRTTLAGMTTVPGLAAIGEVACTGVHGANRLASNSLLECLVMAAELEENLRGQTARQIHTPTFAETQHGISLQKASQELLFQIQNTMWRQIGIIRSEEGIREGLCSLQNLQYQFPHSSALCTAILIAKSALRRTESRGAHFRSDFPNPDTKLGPNHTILKSNVNTPLAI